MSPESNFRLQRWCLRAECSKRARSFWPGLYLEKREGRKGRHCFRSHHFLGSMMAKGWEARNRKNCPWSQSEKERLLGRHLYTVTELSKAPVKPSVDEVIRIVTSRLKSRRTQAQVKRKLAACLREYSLQGQHLDLDTFYLQGSRILTNLPKHVQNNIDSEHLVIKEEEHANIVKAKRSSRSASRRLQDAKGKQYRSISRCCTPATPTRRQQRSKSGDILPAIKIEPSTTRVDHTISLAFDTY